MKISAFKQIKWHKKHDCLHKRYEVCWYHINSMYNHHSEHIFIWCTFSSWLCLWYNDDFKIKHNFIHVTNTTHTTNTLLKNNINFKQHKKNTFQKWIKICQHQKTNNIQTVTKKSLEINIWQHSIHVIMYLHRKCFQVKSQMSLFHFFFFPYNLK